MRGLAALIAGFGMLAAPARGSTEQPARPEPPSYPVLDLIGFTDLDFFANNEEGRASNSGFFQGQFVLHLTSTLSSRLTFVGELSFTARRDAAVDPKAPAYDASVERSILKYTHSDHLKLAVGRHHTPVSYWNTAFHHGQWLQTTIGRPDVVQFGGRLLPVHFVGLLAEGSFGAGGSNLHYTVGVGNGRSAVIHRPGDGQDVNDDRAWVVSVFARPQRPFGLEAGGAYYRDTVSAGGVQHREDILSAHVAWTKETPELIAEYARVRHRDPTRTGTTASEGYYVQLAYRLPALGSRVKPYYRHERIHIAAGDPLLTGSEGRIGHIFGVRVDASELLALKAEGRHHRAPGRPWITGVIAQVSFTF